MTDVFPRAAKIWLIVAWAALFALPWYGIGGIPRGVPSWPAAVHAFSGGRIWLIPLFLGLLPATWAVLGRARPPLLVAAATAMIVWILVEGFAIIHDGWGFEALAGWFAGPAPTQPALGWGALVFLAAMLMLIANGLARQGMCRGDVFVTGAILVVVSLIALFVIYPALCIFVSAVKDNEGGFAPELFAAKLLGRPIWSLDCLVGAGACGTAWNTVAVATVVGVMTTLLGLAFALLALRTRVPMKPLIGLLSVLPIITPPFVIGLALILLFGRSGAVTIFVADLFDLPRTRWIYGVTGITIAQVLAFTPISFLVMIGVLQGVAPSLEEAAETLRAGRWRTFRTITWPLIRPGLANAFLIAFIESMADFANPLMIGGNFTVLSTDIFFAVVGTTHDQGRAAVLAIVLLTFTLTAFQAQRAWVGRRGYATMGGKGAAGRATALPGTLKALCYGLALPYLALTVAVYGTIMVGGFVESVGRDNTPTLRHLITAFSIEKGVGGWFLSGSAWNSLLTTFEIALIAMPFTAAIGIVVAWLLDRQRFAGRQAFEFLAMMSFAIPGTVIGVSYILAFNVPPFALTGTGAIIAIAFAFRNMPVGIRAGIANLAQIDRSLDEASLTLGARSLRTLVLVLLPLMRPAVTTALVYSFVRAVTAVSAVIFLVTGEYQLATVYIVGRADVGDYGVAIVYSAMMIVLMLSILLVIRLGVGLHRPGARPVRGEAALPPATMVQP